MNYELAKQLKDAGFLQGGAGKRVAPSDKIVARREDFAYVPTLEELIEACGGNIESLIQQTGAWVATEFNAWAGSEPTKIAHGTTPTEAVARLWLALNAKSN